MLAIIIIQWVFGAAGAKSAKNEDYGAAGLLYIITFAILAGILTSSYIQDNDDSGTCYSYMNERSSFNAPGNVFIYQMIVSWVFLLIGLILIAVACCCGKK